MRRLGTLAVSLERPFLVSKSCVKIRAHGILSLKHGHSCNLTSYLSTHELHSCTAGSGNAEV